MLPSQRKLCILVLSLFAWTRNVAAEESALTPEKARVLAQEAYIAAYAPVQNYAKQIPQAFDRRNLLHQGTNTLSNVPILLNYYVAMAANIASPNHDTLYSRGVLDLRQQPVVVSAGPVPDPNRYYSLALYDLDTNVLPYISTLTNDNRGGTYLVLGPDNTEPADTSTFSGVIRSPSRLVAILGRVQAFGNFDLVEPVKVQRNFKIQTLSAYQGADAPHSNIADLPAYDEQAAQGLGFLQYANLVFSLQPPDAALATRLAPIHVGAGQDFDTKDFSEDILAAIQQGLEDGAAAVQKASLTRSLVRNGWTEMDPSVLSEEGSFGTDYLTRAAVAYSLIYMNTRKEAWYALAYVDGSGATLNGGNDYRLHFDAGTLPPSRFFWSLTAYDASNHLFFNSLTGRYSIGSNTEGLRYNDDGSLDITIRAQAPWGSKQLANWLPVGQGKPFYLILRSYGPGESILDATYVAPPVERQ